ncbi:alpha-hydroxy-acid oxidizing protein [bacterium]|nr:alpha-hydroxy-acid oxidizing protein [bacterium]
MGKYICEVCEFIYDDNENASWETRPDGWLCPVCGSPKKFFKAVIDKEIENSVEIQDIKEPAFENRATQDFPNLKKTASETEKHFSDIHEIADQGSIIYEAMRTKLKIISWDDILIKGAQLVKIPLNAEDHVDTKTIIGPNADRPLVIESPLYITHMSFGALSKEAKTALAKGSAAAKTAVCSGEGGILSQEFENAYKYIFEYVPNQYSVNEANLKKVDAIEIKIGQSSKPGMGGHLPGNKVTQEIADLRGFKKGEDIKSPSHFPGIKTKDDLKEKVEMLRNMSKGRPIGIKLAAGHIEADLEIALFAKPDFITIDGRAGSTGSSPKFVKASTSIPTIFALYRAKKYLYENNIKGVSLLITGGLRVSSDFAKAIALGADAVAIGTSALMAIGCQQYRVCGTGKCPMGIATQDPELRKRFDIAEAAQKLENFLTASTQEIMDFARLTGNNNLHDLSLYDLCTVNSEISNHTGIEHV